jgi:hypothetical protein
MTDPKPWFLVMTPEDANRPGSQWTRQGAVSFGKVVVRPIAPEGWGAILAFVAVLVGATLAIWLWGFRSGTYSLAFAILATVLVVLAIAIGFARLVRARMTQLPPGR